LEKHTAVRHRKVRFGLWLAARTLGILIFLESIAWDLLGLVRDTREKIALWAGKRYAKEITEQQNIHFRHDTTEIIES
jgi:hypothetical protein